VYTIHLVLHARGITLPVSKKGGLPMIIKINGKIQVICNMIRKFYALFKHNFVSVETWAAALQQRAQGGHFFKHPDHLDGNCAHTNKAQKLGPDL